MALSTKEVAGDESVHYVPPRKKRQRPKPKMQPPLTPMIDVTFQLLLFFLLTFTFRQAEGLIPGTLPGDQSAAEKSVDEPIIVDVVVPLDMVNADAGAFLVDGDRFDTAAALFDELKDRQSVVGSAEQPVVIKPARGVRWQHVVDAFSQAVRAEYKKVGFATAS